jgi:hypothetical protein
MKSVTFSFFLKKEGNIAYFDLKGKKRTIGRKASSGWLEIDKEGNSLNKGDKPSG